jgi:hypothetical protein
MHHQLQVLDLVERLCLKTQSAQVLAVSIRALVDVLFSKKDAASHLVKKTGRILRAVTAKPSKRDFDATAPLLEALRHLHGRVRSRGTQKMVSALSVCNLFLSKLLWSTDNNQAEVTDLTRHTLSDFATRKASQVPSEFLASIARSMPSLVRRKRRCVEIAH